MKKIILFAVLTLVLGSAGITAVFKTVPSYAPDAAAVNEAVITAVESGNQTETVRILNDAVLREQERINALRLRRDALLQVFLYIFTGAVAFTFGALYIYCEMRILSPFKKLRAFAKNVAAGNLNVPLAMDKGNLFGAFTESFDIMREELQKARENERRADISKKELVASLSHDIKTPIASIKAITELMLAKSPDVSFNQNQLNVIMTKADQIDLLITNMFHAALEELEQLKVAPSEMPSTDLYEIIKTADYDGKARVGRIPECFVTADKMRLQQVFDNIVSNSYKYAATDIQVSAAFEGQFLAVEVKDFGYGVAEDELPLVFEKYYRGRNAADKSGAGLGLYITKHLLGKMGGDISCVQNEDGFIVKILLAL